MSIPPQVSTRAASEGITGGSIAHFHDLIGLVKLRSLVVSFLFLALALAKMPRRRAGGWLTGGLWAGWTHNRCVRP